MKTTGWIRLGLCVALFALLAGSQPAFAQAQGQGRGRGMGGAMRLRLLSVAEVQTALKLDDEQKSKIGKINADLPTGGDFRNLSEEERTKRREKYTAAEQEAVKVLTPEQTERLDQISLQVRGASALTDEKVAEKLKITADQKQKLEDIQRETRQKMGEIFQGGGDREANMKKFTELRDESNKRSLAVLSDEQRGQFEKMQGEKITLPDNIFGFGRRG